MIQKPSSPNCQVKTHSDGNLRTKPVDSNRESVPANVRCLAAVFASENEAGPGLIPSGVVTAAKAITKKGRNGSNIETPTLL